MKFESFSCEEQNAMKEKVILPAFGQKKLRMNVYCPGVFGIS